MRGTFPGMAGAALNTPYERLQLLVERLVAMIASEMTEPPKIAEAQTAVFAANPSSYRTAADHRFRLKQPREDVVESKTTALS